MIFEWNISLFKWPGGDLNPRSPVMTEINLCRAYLAPQASALSRLDYQALNFISNRLNIWKIFNKSVSIGIIRSA